MSPLRKIVDYFNQSQQKDVEVSSDIALKIKEFIESADKTLDAELEIKKVLSITPKRFDVDILLKSPERLLAQHAWALLSETAKKDFSEAARCIALSLSTAAAFHLMRATEECVKLLYFDFVKQNRLPKPMWGPMLEKLKAKNQPKPTNELLDQLDIIRKNYRNPTQHPQKFYSLDEAQDLLNSSIVALNQMTREILEHKK